MTVREAIVRGTALLKDAGVATPVLDASLLLADILNIDSAGLILAGPEPLDEADFRRFERSLERRMDGECAAYILGRKEFRGLDFIVTADVLVPRPDTETLVEAALARIDELALTRAGGDPDGALPFPSPVTLLDLCTGSGALAVSLKHERPALRVYASDISGKALTVARKNAAKILQSITGGAPSVSFIESDLFDRIGGDTVPDFPGPPRFDLIVSNPPYVPTSVLAALSPEVRREPRLALDGGKDGLDLIRRSIAGAPPFLTPGGTLLMEADPNQMAAAACILEDRGYSDIQMYKDLAGRMRVIGGRFPA
ncbi:MAG: peptide chain release factor N(5)-glutamine methyltransferase [Treponema sp.]|jgi:release factor glutamine methyltransferase|nr:peptide chain release factor N(5)-glutamine methyltransferase [Treponema sp.]